MNNKQLTFVTGNPGKADEVKRILQFPITHQKIDLLEIQSLDLSVVVEHKALEAYKILNIPVLVEDTSLTFHAMGKLPGSLIKWFSSELKNDGLCRLLDGFADRTAIAETIFGVYDGRKLTLFHGKTEGEIAKKPKGEGFGWDEIFIPKGHNKTWGEMERTEKDVTSMRSIALKKLEEFLTVQ